MSLAALRIEEVNVSGLRTLNGVHLPLSRLRVLIGDNGSGKSSLVEACELLRRAAGEHFLDELHKVHGGLRTLLPPDSPGLELGTRVLDIEAIPGAPFAPPYELQYRFTIAPTAGGGAVIADEALSVRPPGSGWVGLFQRSRSSQAQARVESDLQTKEWTVLSQVNPGRLLLTDYQRFPGGDAWTQEARARMIAALERIQVHVPFEVLPLWVARAHDRRTAMRGSVLIAPANELEQLGGNLANVYHSLRNDFGVDEWELTLDYVRRGIGEDIEEVSTWVDPGGGHIGLALKVKGRSRQLYAAQLADGTLAYLALVALHRLSVLREPRPSLVAFDEPELHLHPQLLMRALDFFESMSSDFPVLLATHSDRLLDGLSDPANAVVLCELTEDRETRLLRPDREALSHWLQRYRGLGDLRSAGHDASVMTEPLTPASAEP